MDPVTAGLLIKSVGTVGGFAAEELSGAGQAQRAQIKEIQDKLERGESLGFTDTEKKAMLTQLSRQIRAEDKGTEAELVRGAQSGARSGNIAKALGELVGQRQSAMASGYGDIAEASALKSAATYTDYQDRLKEQAEKWGDLGKELATIGAGAAVQQAERLDEKKKDAEEEPRLTEIVLDPSGKGTFSGDNPYKIGN